MSTTIRRLRVLLRTAVAIEGEGDSDDDDDEEDENTCGVEDEDEEMNDDIVEPPRESNTPSEGDSDQDDDNNAETAIWDEEDNVYRCKKCLFEVEEGYCGQCDKMYLWDVVRTHVSFSHPILLTVQNFTERPQK
jgi:hypothetical protein